MLVLYFFRLVLMLPVLAAIAVATVVAGSAGLMLRALRWILLVPPLVASMFLLAPDESDARGEGARGARVVAPAAGGPAAVPESRDSAAR